ncbi:MAG: alpha/beta hydrolase [Ardenticatenaceae bacterium]
MTTPPSSSFSLSHISHPSQDKSEGKSPGLLLLHGFGANEQDLMGLAPYLDPRLHIISARAPIRMGFGSFAWYMIHMLPDGSFHFEPEEALESLRLIDVFVDEIIEAYDLDPERFFLAGFSQGAIQSCALLLLNPEKVAGVVAMSGRWPDPVEAIRVPDERLSAKPVLAVHGRHDPVIPIGFARELKKKFEALPVHFTYQEFNMAHNISAESLQLVREWLTEQLE